MVDNRRLKRATFGTSKKLFEHNGDQIFDITPVSASTTLTNAFSVALSAKQLQYLQLVMVEQQETLFSLQVYTIGGNILLEQQHMLLVLLTEYFCY